MTTVEKGSEMLHVTLLCVAPDLLSVIVQLPHLNHLFHPSLLFLSHPVHLNFNANKFID